MLCLGACYGQSVTQGAPMATQAPPDSQGTHIWDPTASYVLGLAQAYARTLNVYPH
jgi:hypothetical protein